MSAPSILKKATWIIGLTTSGILGIMGHVIIRSQRMAYVLRLLM